jgi:hypothetical protein
MTLTVEIKSKPSSPTVWLEVTYSGLEPPVPLFDDLAMVGWTPPAIPPPPASAIDWGRPDPATGQAFTIADYLVEGAVIEAPRGSGPLGRWTDADRRAHFAVLEGVLKRHALLDQVKEGTRPRRAAPPASMPAPPAAPRATAAPMAGPQHAVSARSDAADVPALAAPPVGSARLVAAVAPAAEAALATSLANAGVRALNFTPVHRTVVHRYRGAESEQQVLDHLRLEAMAPLEAVDAVRAAIIRTAVATGQPTPEIVVEVSAPAEDELDDELDDEEPAPSLHAVRAVRSA